MTPKFRLIHTGKHSGLQGSIVMRREQAERVLWLAEQGHWPHLSFRIEPHLEETSMIVFLALLKTWLKTKALAFALDHWQLFVVALVFMVFSVAVFFAPKLERPLLLAGPIVALGLGVLIGKKYFGAAPGAKT